MEGAGGSLAAALRRISRTGPPQRFIPLTVCLLHCSISERLESPSPDAVLSCAGWKPLREERRRTGQGQHPQAAGIYLPHWKSRAAPAEQQGAGAGGFARNTVVAVTPLCLRWKKSRGAACKGPCKLLRLALCSRVLPAGTLSRGTAEAMLAGSGCAQAGGHLG